MSAYYTTFWQGQCFIVISFDCNEEFNGQINLLLFITRLFHHANGIVKDTLKKAVVLLSLIGEKTYKTLH